jgi:hypothetical protein
VSLTASELHAQWGLVFQSLSRSPFARGAALIEACSLLDATLASELPESDTREKFGERVQRAFEDGLLQDTRNVRTAAKLRNSFAHDAMLPSLSDTLTAVSALALADFKAHGLLNEDVEAWVTRARLEARQTAGAVSTDEIKITFSEDTCRTLRAAASSEHDAEGLAAVAIAGALLGTALNTLGKSDSEFVYDHIGKKLADERVWGWISRHTYKEALLEAVMYRNTCVHDLPVGIDSEEADAHVDIMLRATNALYQKLAEMEEAERQRQAEIERKRRRSEAERVLEDYLARRATAHDDLLRALREVENEYARRGPPDMGDVPRVSFYILLALSFGGCAKGCYEGLSGYLSKMKEVWWNGILWGTGCGLLIAGLLMTGQRLLLWHDDRVERAEKQRLVRERHERNIEGNAELARSSVEDYPDLLARFNASIAASVTLGGTPSRIWGPWRYVLILLAICGAAILIPFRSQPVPSVGSSISAPPASSPVATSSVSAPSPGVSSSRAAPTGKKPSAASRPVVDCEHIPPTMPASQIPDECVGAKVMKRLDEEWESTPAEFDDDCAHILRTAPKSVSAELCREWEK